jgi:hypothetical protein
MPGGGVHALSYMQKIGTEGTGSIIGSDLRK